MPWMMPWMMPWSKSQWNNPSATKQIPQSSSPQYIWLPMHIFYVDLHTVHILQSRTLQWNLSSTKNLQKINIYPYFLIYKSLRTALDCAEYNVLRGKASVWIKYSKSGFCCKLMIIEPLHAANLCKLSLM